MTIGVIDLGTGNLGSLLGALERNGAAARILGGPSELSECERIVLPGVGSFRRAMGALEDQGWADAIVDAVRRRHVPILGICLGMQLLAAAGTEGGPRPGLGLIDAQVLHLRELGVAGRVPHIGWNDLTLARDDAHLFDGVKVPVDVYFVHGYALVPRSGDDITATVEIEGTPVVAAVERGNVFGTQFHPEKSSKAGLMMLDNFITHAAASRSC